MTQANKREYDGSYAPRIQISKLISSVPVDKASERIKIRFNYLQKEREDIVAELDSDISPKQRASLIESDRNKASEQRKLSNYYKQLSKTKQAIDEIMVTVNNEYKPEEINWPE